MGDLAFCISSVILLRWNIGLSVFAMLFAFEPQMLHLAELRLQVLSMPCIGWDRKYLQTHMVHGGHNARDLDSVLPCSDGIYRSWSLQCRPTLSEIIRDESVDLNNKLILR